MARASSRVSGLFDVVGVGAAGRTSNSTGPIGVSGGRSITSRRSSPTTADSRMGSVLRCATMKYLLAYYLHQLYHPTSSTSAAPDSRSRNSSTPFSNCIFLFSELTIPAVTVGPPVKPNGLPIAITICPIFKLPEFPN